MAVRVGINGFGRIGRTVLRVALGRGGVEVVAVNDIADSKTLAHLFKYDSIFGPYGGEVMVCDGGISIDGKSIRVFAERDPERIPWDEAGAQIVIESTGVFRTREAASKHLRGTVKKVVISAPASGSVDLTAVMGVNEHWYDPSTHHVLSMASCTTNCLAMVVKVLHEGFRIKRGFMSTVHSYTSDQRLLDAPHKDHRRARAANLSIIPTSTGATKAIEIIFPELKGRLGAMSMRVPTPNVSIVDFACEVEKPATVEAVNGAFLEASRGSLRGYLRYVEEELVSCDFIGDPHSAAFDPHLTSVLDGAMVKVFAWYDNEYGYSSRLVDFVEYLGARL